MSRGKLLAMLVLGATLIGAGTAAAAEPGDLDASFGQGGIVVDPFFDGVYKVRAVAIQADGKIVAVGSGGDAFAIARYLPDGSRDLAFGDGGNQVTEFGPGSRSIATAVALQADGKIVVAGDVAREPAGYPPNDGDFAVARYNLDGSLDPSFSDDGRLTTDFAGGADNARGVAIQGDGAIVAVGATWPEGAEPPEFPPSSSPYDFALARYAPDGSLDESFGSDGQLVVDYSYEDIATQALIAGDGKLIVAGTSNSQVQPTPATSSRSPVPVPYRPVVARFAADGSPDPTFGSDGLAGTGMLGEFFPGTTAAAIQPDGKIVVAAEGFQPAVARLNGDGAIDHAFGNQGSTETGGVRATGVAIQADGRILISGSVFGGPGTRDFALARLMPSGALDPSFAGDGVVTTDIGSLADPPHATDDLAWGIALQQDGGIVLAGSTEAGGGLARYEGRDSSPPGFRVSGQTRQPAGARIEVGVRCDEPCLVTAGGAVRLRRGHGKPRRLGLKRAHAVVDPDLRQRLGLKLARRPARSLRRAVARGRKAVALIRVVAIDQEGNRTTETLRIVLYSAKAPIQRVPSRVRLRFTWAPAGPGQLPPFVGYFTGRVRAQATSSALARKCQGGRQIRVKHDNGELAFRTMTDESGRFLVPPAHPAPGDHVARVLRRQITHRGRPFICQPATSKPVDVRPKPTPPATP